MRPQDLLLFSSPSKVDVPLVTRPPIVSWPRCDSCPGPYEFWKDLPWPDGQPPEHPDYLRGDFWGVELEGLPIVPGGSTKYPSSNRLLSYFLDRYPMEWQIRWLTTCASYGYTHGLLSEADSRGPTSGAPYSPGPPGAGRTLSQFVDTLGLMAAYLKYPIVAIGSKCFNPHRMGTQWWLDYAGPIMEACKGLAKEYTVWEWNLWQDPGEPTIGAWKGMGQMAHAQGATFWGHLSCHYTSWQANDSDRFEFWLDLGDDVNGINYQAFPVVCGWPWSPPRSDQAWDVGDFQARMVDTVSQFGRQGNRHKLRAYETTAIVKYDAPHPTEAEACAVGFLGQCTYDNVSHTDAKVWGYGDGGVRPNGTRL